MAGRPHVPMPPVAFGITSFVLGSIGLLLFFLPILGTPISVIGLAGGLVGCVVALWGTKDSLRWSVAGVALCTLALTINVAIAYAPRGGATAPTAPQKQPVPDRPYAPPPARWPA